MTIAHRNYDTIKNQILAYKDIIIAESCMDIIKDAAMKRRLETAIVEASSSVETDAELASSTMKVALNAAVDYMKNSGVAFDDFVARVTQSLPKIKARMVEKGIIRSLKEFDKIKHVIFEDYKATLDEINGQGGASASPTVDLQASTKQAFKDLTFASAAEDFEGDNFNFVMPAAKGIN